jgi:hypothetical protein
MNRERILDAERSVGSFRANNNVRPREDNYGVMLHAVDTKRQKMVCHKCGKEGHKAANCWSDHVCENCGNSGHIEKFCPEKKVSANKAQVNENKKKDSRKVAFENQTTSSSNVGTLTKNFMARNK